jgi:hypothetical protein
VALQGKLSHPLIFQILWSFCRCCLKSCIQKRLHHDFARQFHVSCWVSVNVLELAGKVGKGLGARLVISFCHMTFDSRLLYFSFEIYWMYEYAGAQLGANCRHANYVSSAVAGRCLTFSPWISSLRLNMYWISVHLQWSPGNWLHFHTNFDKGLLQNGISVGPGQVYDISLARVSGLISHAK